MNDQIIKLIKKHLFPISLFSFNKKYQILCCNENVESVKLLVNNPRAVCVLLLQK